MLVLYSPSRTALCSSYPCTYDTCVLTLVRGACFQMLELQQQLADAESAAASLRDANSDLTSKVDVLQANTVNATLWRRSEVLYSIIQ